MNLIKYPQSCVVIENDDGRVLIDAGNVALDAYALEDFGELDAVLYTHRHADHFDDRILGALTDRGIALYANADVAELLPDTATVVSDGESFDVAGFAITARDLPHVVMVDGSAGPPNTGYVIDGRLFHPGDGNALDGLSVDVLAVPIAGPSISFRDAYRFVSDVGARTAVPIHYDVFVADPDQFAGFCDIADVVVLGHGESMSL